MKEMRERLTKIGSFFAEDFQRTFNFVYPCDAVSDEVFAEANLTTHFLQALMKAEDGLKAGTTWDEFPIFPQDNVLDLAGSKKRVDCVVIEPGEKRITIVESKCLERKERDSRINCESIALDLGRMVKTSNDSRVFPKRVFKEVTNDGAPVRIGVDYNEFTVYGTVVCGVWWPEKHKKTSDEIETMFADGLEEGLRKIESFVDISLLKEFFTKAYEIRLPRILLKEEYWQYFVLISGFHISKRNIPPEELGELDENIYDFSDARGLLEAAEILFGNRAGFSTTGERYGYIVPEPFRKYIKDPPSQSPFGFWVPWEDKKHPDELYCVCGAKPCFSSTHALSLPPEWFVADESYQIYKAQWRLMVFRLGTKKDLLSAEGRKKLLSRIKIMLEGLSDKRQSIVA